MYMVNKFSLSLSSKSRIFRVRSLSLKIVNSATFLPIICELSSCPLHLHALWKCRSIIMSPILMKIACLEWSDESVRKYQNYLLHRCSLLPGSALGLRNMEWLYQDLDSARQHRMLVLTNISCLVLIAHLQSSRGTSGRHCLMPSVSGEC